MVDNHFSDRLEFLAKKFDVFDCDEESLTKKLDELDKEGHKIEIIKTTKVLALLYFKQLENGVSPLNVSVSLDVFSDMIAADPTTNKSCVQWMLTVFTRFLKGGSEGKIQAIRFVDEDLPLANSYITLFEGNKHKQKFKRLSSKSYVLKHVKDPTDINQYKSLSQLFDAVDPFIERNPTELEKLLERYVNAGQALIPVRDRKFTLYIPLSLDASVVFGNFANWCTAKPQNSMFQSYTNRLKPNGKVSNLYVIIDNNFFLGTSQNIYQIHFESQQIKDRHNSQVSIFEDILNESETLSNFFYEELIVMAKESNKGLDNNIYLDFLIQFGFCESLFEIIDSDTPYIKFMNKEIPRLPDMAKFKFLDQLIITNAKMVELNSSIGKLKNLEMLVLTDNRLKVLPKEIGNLNKLMFLNLVGNPLIDVPEEIKYLDKSNGGSLWRLAVDKNQIGDELYQKLKKLLPTTMM
jgi:hypothetical protein